jgi:hypothetical protein
MQQTSAFDPTEFNFTLLRDYRIPGGLLVYEYKNHPTVDGSTDFLRLNLYLTTDGNYVTIWWGLLEPMFAEGAFEKDERLASVEKPADLEFLNAYEQQLFRGYIDSDDAAGHIFKALRITESTQYELPQVLRGGPDNKLKCELMVAVD